MNHARTVFIFALAALPLFAQQAPTTTSDNTQNPPPAALSSEIVVTASSLPERVETTPAAATVITREEIERREARDVSDVLREVPGVVISRTGSQGKAASMFIRGGSSKQALVLWNGVEINNAYFSGYNLGQLSSAGVEKVEVVRGPFSALYGSDAVSGVVNVITDSMRSGANGDLSAGEQGLLNGAISGAFAAERWNVHAALEHRQDDGFAPNDDFDSTSLLGGATYRPFAGASIGLMARISSYDLGIPRNVNGAGTAFVPTLRRREDGAERQFIVPLRYEGGTIAYELRLSEHHRDDHFEDPDAPFGAELADTDARTRTALASARGTTRFGTITVGAEVENSKATHTDTFGLDVDSRDRDSRSLFIEDRVSIAAGANASVEIAAGLRHDDYDAFGSELSPRVAVAYVRNGSKLRGAYGEAFRAPAIGELYVPFFGNADLGAERSRSVEVGYERRSVSGTMFAVTAFQGDYDNLIAFANGRFENIAAASTYGAELNGATRFDRLLLSASYTYLHTEDASDDTPLLRRPKNSGSLAVGYDFAPFDTELVIIHSGARADVTDLAPFGRVQNEAYTTADLTFRYHHGAVTPYVKLENLTDTQYEEVFGYQSAGRRAIVGVRYALGR